MGRGERLYSRRWTTGVFPVLHALDRIAVGAKALIAALATELGDSFVMLGLVMSRRSTLLGAVAVDMVNVQGVEVGVVTASDALAAKGGDSGLTQGQRSRSRRGEDLILVCGIARGPENLTLPRKLTRVYARVVLTPLTRLLEVVTRAGRSVAPHDLRLVARARYRLASRPFTTRATSTFDPLLLSLRMLVRGDFLSHTGSISHSGGVQF